MSRSLRNEQAWLMTGSLVILAIVASGFLLTYTRAVLIPFVLAIFITSIVAPLVDIQILKFGVSRTVAVIVTLLVVACAFFVLGIVSVQAALIVVKSADRYSKDIAQLGRDILLRLNEWNVAISVEDIVKQVQSAIPQLASSTVGSVAGLLSQMVLVSIFVGFLLAARDPGVVRQGVYAEIDTQIRRYLGTKFIISMATGLLVWVTLRIFGLEMATLFGLLAFALNFIPSVGSIIATLLPLPTAVAQFHDHLGILFAVVAVPGVIQLTIGNVIEPKLMGGELKLHPVTILLSLAIWGLLWGPVGMLLAVPITATLRIVLEQFTITQSTSRLLAGKLPGLQSDRPIT